MQWTNTNSLNKGNILWKLQGSKIPIIRKILKISKYINKPTVNDKEDTFKHMVKYPSLHLESKSTRDKERNQQTMSQMSNGFENKKVWIA